MEKISTEELKNLVLDYIVKEYLDNDTDIVTFETPLISSGYIDSFSMVSLLIYIEKKLKIKIPSSKATPEAFDTVNNIVALINQL